MYALEAIAVPVQLMDQRVIFVPVATVALLAPEWKFHVSLALTAELRVLRTVFLVHLVPCALP